MSLAVYGYVHLLDDLEGAGVTKSQLEV